MLAMNEPYTESPSLAIPLGENFHREVVLRVGVCHMWIHREGEPPPPHEDKCVSEKASFLLIKTRKQRGLLFGRLRETTRSQRSLMRSAVFFLKCLSAGGVVVPLEVLF